MCTPAARPAALVSRLTTRCPQTDPDEAFLQPRLKHKPWGGVGWGSGREAWASEGRPAHSPGASTLPSSRTVTPAPHTCHQSQPWCPTQCGIGWHQGPGHGAHTCHSPPAPRTPLTSGRGDPSVASRGSDAAAAWRAGFGGGPRGHHHSVSVSSPPPSGLLPGSRRPSAPQPPTPPCRLGRRPTVHPAVHTQPSRATGPAQPPRHLGTNARRQDPASCTQAWRGPAGEGPARHTLGPAGVLGHGHGLRAARGLFLLGKGPWAGPWALSGHSYGA